MQIIIQLLQLFLIIGIYLLLLFLFKKASSPIKDTSSNNINEVKIDLVFNFIMFFVMSWSVNGFFGDIIEPFFAWNLDKFTPYFIGQVQDNIWIYLLELLFVCVLVPGVLLFCKKGLYTKYAIKKENHFFLKNILYINASYIIMLFLTYYTGLIEYSYILI